MNSQQTTRHACCCHRQIGLFVSWPSMGRHERDGLLVIHPPTRKMCTPRAWGGQLATAWFVWLSLCARYLRLPPSSSGFPCRHVLRPNRAASLAHRGARFREEWPVIGHDRWRLWILPSDIVAADCSSSDALEQRHERFREAFFQRRCHVGAPEQFRRSSIIISRGDRTGEVEETDDGRNFVHWWHRHFVLHIVEM